MARSISGADYRAIARKHHRRRCVVCGAVAPLDVHHKNGNHADNRPGNLEWRCRAHHLQAHGKRVQTRYAVEFRTMAEAERALPTFKGTGASYLVSGAAKRGHGCLLLLALLIAIGVVM